MATQIDISEQSGVRYLHFGSAWIQGAMRIARPSHLELEYTREMMFPMLVRDDPAWPHSVLQIGLGAASLTRFLYKHAPRASLTVVEIDPQVVHAARQHFKLPEDPERVRIVIAEGTRYVRRTSERFDWILVDGFDARGRAGDLDSARFYRNCRQRLTQHGVFTVNLLGRERARKSSLPQLREAFGERVLALPSNDVGNTVAFASVDEPRRFAMAELRRLASRFKAQTAVNLLPTLERISATKRRSAGDMIDF
jgi:spermidine synthase